MKPRVLPTVLAVLILTNPICCQMFGLIGSARSEEPAEACAGCACEGDPSEPSNDRGDGPSDPCGCPSCDLCQCLCAGAIVKDIVTVDDMDRAAPIHVIVERPIDTPLLLAHATCFRGTPMACDHTNVGRAARILQGSLLC